MVESKLEEFPASFVVISHPQEGFLLYDTGDYPPLEDGVDRPDFWKEYFPNKVHRDSYIDRILPSNGIKLEDVSAIILSHMHYDHAGGIKFFANTKAGNNIYVPKADFVEACLQTINCDNEKNTTSAYWRSILTAKGLKFNFLEDDIEIFPGVHLFLLSDHTPAVATMVL
ncbi:MAG: MBL fold metallo-hydrolase [Fastidiosipilaceae bacterium]